MCPIRQDSILERMAPSATEKHGQSGGYEKKTQLSKRNLAKLMASNKINYETKDPVKMF